MESSNSTQGTCRGRTRAQGKSSFDLPADGEMQQADARQQHQSPSSADQSPPIGDMAPEHRRQIDESGIAPDVAAARGYRTASKRSELKGLGFSESQCKTPALLIPIYGVHGEIVNYQARPNEPRIVKGKAIKYETPKGSKMALDVPRPIQQQLLDPNIPLWITEGAKKADAAVSRGLCAIALLGVWNWRGTNESGGKTALADWDAIATNGRKVYLAFDSDVIEKRAVHAALGRLKAFLETKSAQVRIIRLPPGPGGAKVGLDNYLAAGHSVQDLLDLAAESLPKPVDGTDSESGPYFVRDGHTYQRKQQADGEIEVHLANFSAVIKSEVQLDDGQESSREFELEGTFPGGATVTFCIPARSYATMNWPLEHLGAVACVSPGHGAKEHLRAAVQGLSGRPERRTVYTHSGWRQIPGIGWVYLHASGSIGPIGPITSTHTRLGGGATGMVLPDPLSGVDLIAATSQALIFLDLGKPELVYPLLAATFRAALGESDFSIYLYGSTGTFKTETATVCQSYFGTGYHSRNLPGSFLSTSNALEALAFQLKDALFVVDDWVPEGSGPDVQRQHATISRLLRSQGNLQGRGRLASDASQRASKPPRGLTLVTAEDVPSRLSALARTLMLEVRPGELRTDVLSKLQRQVKAGTHAQVMSSFLCWVAQRYEQVKEDRKRRSQELRDGLNNTTNHKRTASIAGELQAGFEAFLAFAQDSGALDQRRFESLRSASWRAIREASATQSKSLATSDPGRVFVRLLEAAIGSGRAHIEDIKGGAPLHATSLGWRSAEPGSSDFEAESKLKPLGACVGWTDGVDLFLEPSSAFREAQQMASDSERLSITSNALSKRLNEKGWLLSTEQDKGHLTVRRWIGKRRPRVLHLSLGLLLDAVQSVPSVHDTAGEASEGDSGAIPGTDSVGAGEQTGPGNRSQERPGAAPDALSDGAGPVGPIAPVSETVPRAQVQESLGQPASVVASGLAVADDDASAESDEEVV